MSLYHRVEKLTHSLSRQGFDALAVMPGSSLFYLSGLTFHHTTRLTLAFFPVSGDTPCLVLPEMEVARVEASSSIKLLLFPWSDAVGPAEALRRAIEATLPASAAAQPVVGVEYTVMRVMELRMLEEFTPSAHMVDATALLAGLRMVKEELELTAIRRAVQVSETALRATINHIKEGITERQLAEIWSKELQAAGAEGESFAPIVASGPNSANPHHTVSDRPFAVGDLIILDGGARAGGYVADMTRTIALGEPSDKARRIYGLVHAANLAGQAAVQPYISAEQLDRATRLVIMDGGYGDYFLHRTGHGIGLDVHEPPYIVEGNSERIPPGATFTIEPGIYVPGLGGVRIEDDVLVTENGCESLTQFERELMVLPAEPQG